MNSKTRLNDSKTIKYTSTPLYMRRITCLFIALIFSSVALQAQKSTPVAVLNAFAELNPEVNNPFWECREGAFVAMFSHEDGLKKVFFDQDGQWLETRTRLMVPALPKGVKQFVEQLYATRQITYLGKVEQPSRTIYRVETETLNNVSIKLLNEGGEILEEDRIELSLIPR